MKEIYAHELEGQTIIIETVSDKQGTRKPVGYFLRVRLEETGLIVENVVSINLSPMPLIPCEMITAEIALRHTEHGISYETVTISNPKLSFAAFVEKEICE